MKRIKERKRIRNKKNTGVQALDKIKGAKIGEESVITISIVHLSRFNIAK